MGGPVDRAAKILGMRQTYHAEGTGFRLRTYQDVEPHLDHAARLRREQSERGVNRQSAFRPRMTAPFNIILGVAQKLGIQPKDVFEPEQQKRIWKELEGVDYKRLRLTNAKRL